MGNSYNKPNPIACAGRDFVRTAKAHAKAQQLAPLLHAIRIDGYLVLAGMTEEYHALRSSAYSYNDCGYPYAIFLPKHSKDVSIILKAIGTLKLDVVVACGKHSAICFPDNTLVIDLKYINSVKCNLKEKWIDIGGGSKLHKADELLQGTGYGFVTGTNPDTGVGGLTLAGGWGWLARSHGMAIDNWIEADVVLPNGKIVLARDDNQHAKLLQALRGGGGGFGVVTRFRFRLYDVRDCSYGKITRFAPTIAAARQVVQEYRSLLLAAPNHCSGVILFPCGSQAISEIAVSVGALGTANKCTFMNKFENLSSQWANISRDIHYQGDYHTGLQKILVSTSHRGYGSSAGSMVAELSNSMIDTILHYTRKEYPSKASSVIAIRMGGKIHNEPVPHSMSHRMSGWWLLVEAVLPDMSPAEVKKHLDWVSTLQSNIRRISAMEQPTTHTFFDAVGNSNTQIRTKTVKDTPIKAFLREAKAYYDPKHVFHMY